MSCADNIPVLESVLKHIGMFGMFDDWHIGMSGMFDDWHIGMFGLLSLSNLPWHV